MQIAKYYPYHCDLCRCPIENWKPLENYKTDRCCEAYCLINDLFEEEEQFTLNDFLSKYSSKISKEFPDIKDVKKLVDEIIQIQVDLGPLEEISANVYRTV